MHDSKLIQLASTLSVAELRQFEEFCRSPLFNKQEVLARFAALIRREAPDFQSSALERESLFAELFPGEPFHLQKLFDHGSYLLKLLERFLAVAEFLQAPQAEDTRTLTQLRTRGQHALFRRRLREAAQKLEKSTLRDENWFRQSFELASESEAFHAQVTQENQRSLDDNLAAKAESLDDYYLASRLKLACEMVNRSNVIGGKFDLTFLNGILLLYQAHQTRLAAIPAIQIYYIILQTLLHPGNRENYRLLLSQLDEQASLFTPAEARAMYQYALNYCIRQINSGHPDFLGEVFELYKKQLETGLMLENGRLSQWDFKNIVSAALRMGEIDWTENFIRDYLEFLEPDLQENAFAYNQAQLEYQRNNFGEVLRLLQRVEFTDIFYQLGTRSTLLRTFYELEEWESLRSHLSAFRIFLDRTRKMSDYQRKIHKNLLSFTRKLLRLRENALQLSQSRLMQEVSDLLKALEKGQDTANLAWLREKTQDLISG